MLGKLESKISKGKISENWVNTLME
jgi:hypothetical protein